jgi:putative heme-binding domain-containing protein
VRFELSRALPAIEGPEKIEALVTLANLESADKWISAAIVGSVDRSAGDFLRRLLASDPAWRRNPTAGQLWLLNELAAAIAGSGEVAQLVRSIEIVAAANPAAVGPGDLAILSGLAQGLADRGQAPRAVIGQAAERFKSKGPILSALVSAARAMATAEDESLEHRLVAVDVLKHLDPGAGKLLLDLLDVRHSQELQSAAAGAIASADAPTAEAMLASWPTRTLATRRALISAALRSRSATAALLTAVEREQILPAELDTSLRHALRAVRDPALEPRIKQLLRDEATADRAAVVARYQATIERQGDRVRGAALFEKHCLACHTLQGSGHRVGPDLSGVAARPKDTLIVDLFDPSRQLTPDFTTYTLITQQGQVLSGVLVSETATSVTLRRAEGAQDFVLRSQIEQLRSTGKSLMPEGMEEQLSEQDVADLLDFLARPEARLFSSSK